ncbi:MAG: hypothetical protein WBG71_02045 [Leeuwenhoekiella sp.]
MKKLVVSLIAILIAFASCEKDSESTERIEGKFLYYDGSGILQKDNVIYGVKIDDQAEKLIEMTKGYQVNETDMVPVMLKVVKNPKAEGAETWDTIVTVKEILAVMHPEKEDQEIILNKPEAVQ